MAGPVPVPPPADAPKDAPPAPGGGGGSSVQDDIAKANQGLTSLMEKMASAGDAISPDDKQRLGSLISEFQSLVDDLGKGPGQGAPKAPPEPPAPMDANAAPDSKPY